MLWVFPVFAQEVSDPIEPVNRAIFKFNDKFDIYILEPVARGYNYVLPHPIKTGISNFFDNIRFPIYLVSDIIGLKCKNASTHIGRFVINSTVGILGFIDVAKKVGLEPVENDFGIALGSDGVPAGPYLVLPFLGPSNIRDGVGRVVDTFLTPTYYVGDIYTSLSLRGVEVVDDRRKLLDAIETAKKGTLDYYVFVRSTYNQRRLSLIYEGDVPPELLGEPSLDEEDPDANAEQR